MKRQAVESRAAEVIADWLVVRRPKLGKRIRDGHRGDLGKLRRLVCEQIADGTEQAEPAAEYVRFALRELMPDDTAFDRVCWSQVAEALQEAFCVDSGSASGGGPNCPTSKERGMPRMKPDSLDAIAEFFEEVAAHMEENRGIFPGSRRLTAAEARIVTEEVRGIARRYREDAIEGRTA